jgi:tetratricopeptide (TPR) repeat protein
LAQAAADKAKKDSGDSAESRAVSAPDNPADMPRVKPKPTLRTQDKEPDPFAEPSDKGADKADKKPAPLPDPFAEPTTPKPETATAPATKGTDRSDKKPEKTTAPGLFPDIEKPAKTAKPADNDPFFQPETPGPNTKKPAEAMPAKEPDKTKAPDKTPAAEAKPNAPITTILPSDTKSTEPQTPGAAELKQGQDLIQTGNYEEAIDPLKKAIKLAPTDGMPHYQLGVAYRMLKRFDDAIEEFSAAIKLDADLSDAYLRRGVCWYYKDEFNLAQSDFEDAAGVNFNDPRPLTWKGMALVRQGLVRDAINAYSQALRYDNHNVLAHVNRGLAYLSLQDYDKATADFDQAIRNAPKDAANYFRRGQAQGGAGNWQAAVKSYSEAIRLNPQYAEAYRNRSSAYQQLGDSARAQADSAQWQQLQKAANNATTQATATVRR